MGNTLQHTTAHCNTLQHTATHCNTLQHISVYHLVFCCVYLRACASVTLFFSRWVMQHCTGFARLVGGRLRVHRAFVYSAYLLGCASVTLQYIATLYNTLQCTTPRCTTLRYTATHCNTLKHTASHYTATRRNTAQAIGRH